MENNAGSNRFITVKGIGSITAQPDLTTITMKLETKTMDYEQTMQRATSEIELVRQALISIGHERQALKTIDFNVNTDYDSQRDAEGNFIRRFTGYKCSHALKLEMDFNMKRLGETLDAISASGASPEFQIAFSVKDKAAVSIAATGFFMAERMGLSTISTQVRLVITAYHIACHLLF